MLPVFIVSFGIAKCIKEITSESVMCRYLTTTELIYDQINTLYNISTGGSGVLTDEDAPAWGRCGEGDVAEGYLSEFSFLYLRVCGPFKGPWIGKV